MFCRDWLAFGFATGGLLLVGMATLHANPVGGEVTAGQVEISTVGSALHIQQTSDRAVINWRDFSIQPGEMTQFHQPSASSAVLNRVTSTTPSQLMGQLQANGQVYLMNPNGIFFGPGAVINASSFLAATADLSSAEFMAGRLGLLVTSEPGVIRNEGAIRGEQGSVQLLSKSIENTGTLEAPKGEVGLY
ncbi:MAG: filamentous hemagglutinin N-terminal domain-containing protein, partial [Verrucomicrobia bacterium]|nr:filamentous hemagglutinin N-terminal domain-containing protein [Verrucomicrobiota bacterium]